MMMWSQDVQSFLKFHCPYPWRLHIKCGSYWLSGFREEFPMQHTKCRGNRPAGSVEEDGDGRRLKRIM